MKVSIKQMSSLLLVVAMAFSTWSCSDDGDSGSPDSGTTQDAEAGQDGSGDADSSTNTWPGSCEEEHYRDFETDSCEACPSPEFSCDMLDLDASEVDTSTNVVTVVRVSPGLEVLEARASGMKITESGLGGGTSESMGADGTVDGNQLTFDFSEHADAEELRVTNLRIREPCRDEDESVTLTVDWEPNGEVTSDFGCLPSLDR